jgi:hypothetical protein
MGFSSDLVPNIWPFMREHYQAKKMFIAPHKLFSFFAVQMSITNVN